MKLTANDKASIKALLNREPSLVELYIFDTMWSEHCSYKSTKDVLKKYLPTKGSEVALGIGEDSGIIRFEQHEGKSYCIAISHESHNHPSQLLPVEGAATGVGGVVRDVYCMGADVIGVMNSLHFGIDDTGKNPLVDEIAKNVVLGVSDYANPLGVPVLGGETLYHHSYNDNCLVNVAALGLVEESQIIRSKVPKEALNEPYDMILIGKSTDATGFGGASFSSATLDQADESTNIGAVQVHDPFLKRVIVEAIKALLEIVNKDKVSIGFKDLGAGGIACASSELASAGGFGVNVNLDAVNVAFSGLAPEIIACSETQERFCLAVPKWFTPRVLTLFNETYALPSLYPHAGAAVIGHIINEPVYRLSTQDQVVCELPISAITTDVKADRPRQARPVNRTLPQDPTVSLEEIKTLANRIVADKNVISKRYVYRYFDNAVRGDTVIYPGEGDAVVTTPVKGSVAGLTASMDSNLYGDIDPYTSGAYAVAEAVRNVVAVGGRPLAITDCLNYGNPENPSVMFDFEEGVKGIADAAHGLSFLNQEPLPVISGNVSLYNDSKQGRAVVPSPVIVVIGKVPDFRKALTMYVTEPNITLLLVGQRYPEFGATLAQQYLPQLNNVVPQVRFTDENKANQAVYHCIQNQWLKACHDISGGGIWTAVIEMLLGERSKAQVGATLNLSSNTSVLTQLFSENGGFVLAVSKELENTVKDYFKTQGVFCETLGYTHEKPSLSVYQKDTHLWTTPVGELELQRESKN